MLYISHVMGLSQSYFVISQHALPLDSWLFFPLRFFPTSNALSPVKSIYEQTLHFIAIFTVQGFSGGSDGKGSAYNAGDLALIPGSGRSPGEGNGNPLQYSCLENSMDRGAWQTTVLGVAKSWTWLSNSHFHFYHPIQPREHLLNSI